MQRLADFQRRAWRCESPSPPNASLQRQHTGMYTFFTHTHTHCLPLPSANPQHQHNPLLAPRRCNRAKQATSLVASPRRTGSGPCLGFCFSGKHTRPALFKVLCTIRADNLTKRKKSLAGVGASSRTPAKPFILEPMCMGQTVSAL